jgi:hypothetical protein
VAEYLFQKYSWQQRKAAEGKAVKLASSICVDVEQRKSQPVNLSHGCSIPGLITSVPETI